MRLQTTLILAAATAGLAHATVFDATFPSYIGGSYSSNNGGGVINSVKTQYATGGQILRFEANMGNVPGTSLKTDAFTLAISDGPNPKGTPGQLALFYFDGTNAAAPALTVYGYNGANSASSYRDGDANGVNDGGDFIISSKTDSSFIRNIFVRNEGGNRVLGFDIDASVINSHVPAFGNPSDWEGARMGQQFGIWFHPRANTVASYDGAGHLTNFASGCEGWLDGANITTEVVPEPAALLALGVGGLCVFLRRRNAS